MEQHFQKFDTSEENKLIYMDIFNEYTAKLESYIIDRLNTRLDNFSMEYFTEILEYAFLSKQYIRLLIFILCIIMFMPKII